MKKIFSLIMFLILFLAFLQVRQAAATVILRLGFDQVVTGAELIFEGKVISQETRPSPVNGRPFTYFTFEIIEVIKGDYTEPTIEIGYMGGQLGEFTLKVSDMRMPEMDERGIYFVESLSKQQIHPLIGWQQGHYLVETDQRTGVDMVIPMEEDVVETKSHELIHFPTVEAFKNSIHNVMGRDQ